MHFKKLFFLLFSTLISVSLCAQEISDYQKYMDSAGNGALLFRGHSAKKYLFKYTGTFYAYDAEYLKGEIYYNKKHYSNIYINLNSHFDEVYIKTSPDQIPVGVSDKYVESFKMGDKQFVRLSSMKELGMVEGYYQILCTKGKYTIYKRIDKLYKEEIDQRSVASVGLERMFDQKIAYFLFDGSDYVQIRKKKDLLNHFPEQKKEIKKKLSQTAFNRLYVARTDKDGLFVTILNFVEE